VWGSFGAAALAAATARADGSKADTAPAATASPSSPRPVQCDSGENWEHVLGLVLDAGQGPLSLGGRYLNQYRTHSGCGGLGFVTWLGAGAEVRAEETSAMVTQAVARLGGAGDAMAFGFELAGGAGTDFARTIATGSAALLFDFYYFGIGGSYQFPIGFTRPAWLGAIEVAVRIQVPIFRYGVHEEQHVEQR
jgi:hypothetical protein